MTIEQNNINKFSRRDHDFPSHAFELYVQYQAWIPCGETALKPMERRVGYYQGQLYHYDTSGHLLLLSSLENAGVTECFFLHP